MKKEEQSENRNNPNKMRDAETNEEEWLQCNRNIMQDEVQSVYTIENTGEKRRCQSF